MGWWGKDDQTMVMGDEPADIMGKAIADITAVYEKEWGRKPTQEELERTFKFVTAPLFNYEH